MNLIIKNPFRILGLPLTATEREITKQVTTLTTYLEMGKAKNFDTDYTFLPPVQRTNSVIEEAKKRIEQTETKFLYSLFWFWFNNSADEVAMEFLKEGNYRKAIEFWEKSVFAHKEKIYKPIILYKNLIQDSSDWSDEDDESHTLIKEGGVYTIERKKEANYSIPCVYADVNYNDNWIIECKSQWIDGVDNVSYGIAFGRTKGSYYFFGIAGSGSYLFGKYDDWTFTPYIEWTDTSHFNKWGSNHLQIRKTENKLNFYINNRFVNSYESEPFFGKYFGFKVTNNQKVSFSDFSFSKLVPDIEYSKGLIKEILFSNAIDKFKNSDTESYSYTVNNGSIELLRKTEGTFFTSEEFNIDSSKNFIIGIESRWIDGVTNNSYGIIWGKAKAKNDFFNFGISKNGYIYIEKYIDWEEQKLLGWKKVDCINDSGINLITIRKIEDTYYFYVNETLVYEMPFEPFFGNYLGFKISGIQRVEFCNYQISYLNPNPDYAKGIIVTPKTFSNAKNLSTLFLALSNNGNHFNKEYFTKGISLAGTLFANGHMEEYCRKIGASNLIYNSEKSQQFFVNEICDSVKEVLDNSSGIKTTALIQSFSSFPHEGKQFVINKFLSKRIKFIEDEIEFAANQRKGSPDKSLTSGLKLLENTKNEITILKSSLGEADIQYGILADKLSYEIIQCAIDHFNHTKDDMPCLPLYQFGADIAISERAKERANENLISCKEWIEEKPKREAFDYIYDQLNDSVGLLNKDKLHKEFYLESAAEKLVQNTLPKLNTLKRLLGKADEEYIKISSEVVSITLAMIIAYHNSTASPNFETSISLLNTIGSFEMDAETSERLRSNKSILENNRLIRRNYASSSSSSSGSSSCYIATMVYGSSESKEVLILRKYRDDVLKKYWVGRNFIYYYYKYSPQLVAHLKNNKKINLTIKKILDFIIKIIYK